MAATHIYGYSVGGDGGRVVEIVEVGSLPSGTPADGTVTNTKLATVPTATIKGRSTAGTGAPEDLTAAQVRTMLDIPTNGAAFDRANHTGTQLASTISDFAEALDDRVNTLIVDGTNITTVYDDGAGTLTISAATGAPGADSVTNTLLANMATSTIKGRVTAGTGDPEDLTATQVRTLINVTNGATANLADATLLARANHTGTQLASTISDFAEAVDDRIGTAIIAGPNVTITYDDVANTLEIEATAAASGNFVPGGAGAVTRAMNTRVAETGIYVTDYYNSGTDGSDYSPALTRALVVSNHVIWPAGSYTMNTKVAYTDNAVIRAERSFSDDVGGTKITCNAGFVYNTSTTRKRIHIIGFSLNGNNTAGVAAIGGPFGGMVERTRFKEFAVGIENASSFLSDYELLAFGDEGGGIAISLADSNGVSISRCYFAAQWDKHISTMDVTPLTGSDNGMAMHLYRNNHNASGNVSTGNSLLTVSGNITMIGNYFEAFPAASDWGGVFVEIKVNGFGDFGLLATGNEMNGGGSDGALHAFLFNGSRTGTLPNDYGATITSNRLLGFDTALRPAIACGSNNMIPYMKVYDNLPIETNAIDNLHARSIYRPIGNGYFSGSTNISGGTYITLPISTTQDIDNSDSLSSNTYTVRKDGYYRIAGDVQLQSTASSLPDIDLRFTKNGTEIYSMKTSVAYISGTTYQLATLDTIVHCVSGDTILFQARGGQTASKARLTLNWLGTGQF